MPETTEHSSEFNQEQTNWMLTQAYTRLMHGKIRECITLLRALRLLCPDEPGVYSMLGYACLENNEPEECLQMVDKYLELAASEDRDKKEIEWIRKRAQLRIDKNKTNPDRANQTAI